MPYLQSLNPSKPDLFTYSGIVIIRMAHSRILWHKEVVPCMIRRCVLLNIGESDKLIIQDRYSDQLMVTKLILFHQESSLTDCVARICSWGSVDSNSFCTIFRKLSINKFRVCAWQATRSWSIASIAITTKPFRLLLRYSLLEKKLRFFYTLDFNSPIVDI